MPSQRKMGNDQGLLLLLPLIVVETITGKNSLWAAPLSQIHSGSFKNLMTAMGYASFQHDMLILFKNWLRH